MSTSNRTPSLMVRLQVLAAVDYAPGQTIRARIRGVSQQQFVGKRRRNYRLHSKHINIKLSPRHQTQAPWLRRIPWQNAVNKNG